MYKTFKQYLLEASNLSLVDRQKIDFLLMNCYIKGRSDINIWLDTIVNKFIANKSNHTNSEFFTKEEIINVNGQKDIRDVFKDVNNALEYKISNITDYLNKTYTVEQASIKYGNNFVRLSFVDAEKEYKNSANNIKEVEGIDYEVVKKYSDGYKMISLLTQKSLDREGKCLGHCTKDEQHGYLKKVQNNILKVISLRDNKNGPHATLQYIISNDTISQIKGNGNGPVVSKYIPYIIDYLNDNNFEEIEDLQNINAFKIDNTVYDIDHIPRDLVIKKGINIILTNLTKIPHLPQKISGDFKCEINEKLLSLSGSPQLIDGSFYCIDNKQLSSLIGGPQKIKGAFWCKENLGLTSLKGCPTEVGLDFMCYSNLNLTTLEGLTIQHIHGNLNCSRNNLTTLKHCPPRIDGYFYCSHNNLTTLEGGPLYVKNDYFCPVNLLTSLKGAPRRIEKGNFTCSNNSHLISLEGIPDYINGDFICINVGKKFTEEEIRKVCDVKGRVIV